MDAGEPIDKIVIKFEMKSQCWVAPHSISFEETRETMFIIDGGSPFQKELNGLERFRNSAMQVIAFAMENSRDPGGNEPAFILLKFEAELEDCTSIGGHTVRVEQDGAGKNVWAIVWLDSKGNALRSFAAESGEDCLGPVRLILQKITANWMSLVEFNDKASHPRSSKGEPGSMGPAIGS